MASTEKEIPHSWDSLNLEQLKVYAQELAELYRKEQKLRQELETKNWELEQRARELSALNAMFKKNLDLRFQSEEALTQLMGGIRTVAKELNEVLSKAEDLTNPPNPPGAPGPG